MKRHLNTLFVTTEETYLRKSGQAVEVRRDKELLLRVPLHNLDGIVCFGRVGFSADLAAACAENNVTFSLMSPAGRFRASVVGYSPGNVVLRRQQYRASDDPQHSVGIARNCVAAKIANSRGVLLRAARDTKDHAKADRLKDSAKRLLPSVDSTRRCVDLEELRGIEGEAATRYFARLNDLQNVGDDDFHFTKRSRRPPLDAINAVLSFVYTLMMHDARSACESCGLDAAVGFLHRDRPGRPGLALDLMEEFRPFLCDRLVLSLINRKQIRGSGFTKLESGAVIMDDATRKSVLVAFQKRKQDVIEHPFLQEKTTVGLLIHLQARLLARHLRGDLEEYPSFIWR